jgi:hypothetical protein
MSDLTTRTGLTEAEIKKRMANLAESIRLSTLQPFPNSAALIESWQQQIELLDALDTAEQRQEQQRIPGVEFWGAKIIRAAKEGRMDIVDSYAEHWAQNCENEGQDSAAACLRAAVTGGGRVYRICDNAALDAEGEKP